MAQSFLVIQTAAHPTHLINASPLHNGNPRDQSKTLLYTVFLALNKTLTSFH